MKEFEIVAIDELMKLYLEYSRQGLTPEIEKRAKGIEGHYLMSSPIVGEATTKAISWISSIYVHKVVPQLTSDKIESIIRALRTRKEKLSLENTKGGENVTTRDMG